MRDYDWLLFDADGTLFDYDRAESTALAQSFQEAGLPFGPAALAAYRAINRDLWQALERGQIAPGVLKVRRFELLLGSLGIGLPAPHFSERYLDNLAHASELVDGAEDLLRACAGAYRFALLTNGLSRVQRTRLAHSTLSQSFSAVVISEEVGCAKPAPAFFDHAFEMIGKPPRWRALMIGDNWTSDITGAAAYGLDACWFNPGGLPRPASPAILFEVTTLRQLRDWLV